MKLLWLVDSASSLDHEPQEGTDQAALPLSPMPSLGLPQSRGS